MWPFLHSSCITGQMYNQVVFYFIAKLSSLPLSLSYVPPRPCRTKRTDYSKLPFLQNEDYCPTLLSLFFFLINSTEIISVKSFHLRVLVSESPIVFVRHITCVTSTTRSVFAFYCILLVFKLWLASRLQIVTTWPEVCELMWSGTKSSALVYYPVE